MVSATHTPATSTLPRALLAGLAAGAITALLAALVNLPLKSPDDAFFNSATVVIGALAAGIAGGVLWQAVQRRRQPQRDFLVCMAAAFVLVAGGALLLEALPDAPLSGIPRFVVPLAAIVFGGVALLVPLFARPAWRAQFAAPVTGVAALALGIALAGQGDAESGRLALPDAPAVQTGAAVLRPADVAGMAYTVSASESTVTYTVREKLAQLPLPNDAVGKTSQVSGTLHLDGRPSTVTVDVSTFASDQRMRDNFIRTNPRGPNFAANPQAQLVISELDLPAEYTEGETVTRTVSGMMTIRGVTRPQTFAIEARLAGGVLTAHATTDFTWADYQIPAPNIGGFVQVEDNVHIEVLLVAQGARG
jgi:polyisoprenoid-binding protein YceI